jgi:hypothetical protein
MRRWFELGNGGTDFAGPWSLNSDRTGRRDQRGAYPPRFVSMPFKETLFEWLSAAATSQVVAGTVAAIYVIQQDQGVDPDPACPAQHIPRAFSMNVVATPPFVANPILQTLFGPPTWTESGTWTGNYGPSLLTFNSEPPSKNG